jgi:hypothetical protein
MHSRDPDLRFRRWRIALGAFGVVLLLSSLEGLFHEIDFDWWSFGLAIANLSAAYFGFRERPRYLVKLAVVWSALDILVVEWTILIVFLRHVVSSGTWNFSAIH